MLEGAGRLGREGCTRNGSSRERKMTTLGPSLDHVCGQAEIGGRNFGVRQRHISHCFINQSSGADSESPVKTS